MVDLLLVMLSGAVGCGSRFLIGRTIANNYNAIGLATWIINITGCFLIGLGWSYLLRHGLENSTAKQILLVGFLGGFTTFSAFSLDTILLLQTGSIFAALGNIFLQPMVGVLVTYGGFKLLS